MAVNEHKGTHPQCYCHTVIVWRVAKLKVCWRYQSINVSSVHIMWG